MPQYHFTMQCNNSTNSARLYLLSPPFEWLILSCCTNMLLTPTFVGLRRIYEASPVVSFSSSATFQGQQLLQRTTSQTDTESFNWMSLFTIAGYWIGIHTLSPSFDQHPGKSPCAPDQVVPSNSLCNIIIIIITRSSRQINPIQWILAHGSCFFRSRCFLNWGGAFYFKIFCHTPLSFWICHRPRQAFVAWMHCFKFYLWLYKYGSAAKQYQSQSIKLLMIEKQSTSY